MIVITFDGISSKLCKFDFTSSNSKIYGFIDRGVNFFKTLHNSIIIL